MKYRITHKVYGKPEQVGYADSLAKAMVMAGVILDTFTGSDGRTGSLRNDGNVTLWKGNEQIGYVSVERMRRSGVYVLVGG